MKLFLLIISITVLNACSQTPKFKSITRSAAGIQVPDNGTRSPVCKNFKDLDLENKSDPEIFKLVSMGQVSPIEFHICGGLMM